MKTNCKKSGDCQVRLEVQIDAAEAAAITKDVERAFVREAKIPGFRPGKVPVEIVRSRFADALSQEMRRVMVERTAKKAIDAEKLKAVAVVEAKDLNFGPDGGSFTVSVDVEPEFKLPAYKGLKIVRNDTAVKDEEVQAQVESLRKAYARYEDAKDGEAAADGDIVQFSYSGTVDGKSVLEVAPEAKAVASAEGFWTQLEEGRFLPEILDALQGMKSGESKEGISVKFAPEGAPEGLGGKTAEYSITLQTVRKRILPDDEALAGMMKAENAAKMVADIRERMQKQADAREAARREDSALDLLLKKCDFALPRSQVEAATDDRLKALAYRAQQSGIDASYFESQKDKIRREAEEAAEKQLRGWYVLRAIAEAEKLEGESGELAKKALDFVLANAK